uniref:Uncharacterized protein n=1 Tax=Rhizophora mucronata TaxID=61149 RepID=A0A2P2PF08_RHIMU
MCTQFKLTTHLFMSLLLLFPAKQWQLALQLFTSVPMFSCSVIGC